MSPSSPQPPASARISVRLIWGGAVVSLLGILLLLMQTSEIRRQVEASLLFDTDVDETITMIIVFGVVFGLIGTALWIWMAIMNGMGRNWARIVATVFGGLHIAGNVTTLAIAGSGLGYGATVDGHAVNAVPQVLLAVGSTALAVTVIVLMWRETSSQWYAAMGRARRAARAQAQPMPAPMLPPNQI